MSESLEPATFHLRINDGPEQTVIVKTGIYMYAAVAACAILGAAPRGSEKFLVEIWVPELLPDYGPVHYLIGEDEYGGISVSHAVLGQWTPTSARPPPPTTAYRDGWLAHALGRPEVECPYHPELAARSHRDWLQGHRDRAAKLPDDPYLKILDAEMMGLNETG